MDAQLKAKWIEALRSGDFKQGHAALFDDVGEQKIFCCLGVLCETQGTQWGDIGDQGQLGSIQVRDIGRSFLSKEALDHFGLTEDQQVTLATMNDDGSDFSEIADYIESNL